MGGINDRTNVRGRSLFVNYFIFLFSFNFTYVEELEHDTV
jgi:hypothetical protein